MPERELLPSDDTAVELFIKKRHQSSYSDHIGQLGVFKSKLNGSDKEILSFLLSKTQFETKIFKS